MTKDQIRAAFMAFIDADLNGMAVENMQNIHKETIVRVLQSALDAQEEPKFDSAVYTRGTTYDLED